MKNYKLKTKSKKLNESLKMILLFAFALVFMQKINAQEKFQLNFMLAPSYEKITPRNTELNNPFSYRFSYHFGGEVKYFLSPKISTNLGLQFNDRGFKAVPRFDYQGDTITSTVNISLKYISIPFDLCFNFQPAFRTELFVQAGLTYGFLVNQSFKGKRVPVELGRPDNSIYEGVSNERSNINWFDRSYTSINLGFGISRYILSRMVITVNPYLSYQLDRLISAEGPIIPFAVTKSNQITEYSPKLNSYSLQLKIGYYFSDQIENTKKTL